MAKQKAINWPVIKKRYLQGEKPKDIARDFGLTAKQVSDKANKEKWIRIKAEIIEKVAKKIEDEFEAIQWKLLDEYKRLSFSNMRRITSWNASGLDIKDSGELSEDDAVTIASITEQTNNQGTTIKFKLHSKTSAMDSLAEIVGLKKKEKEDPGEGQQESGFVGLPGINVNAI